MAADPIWASVNTDGTFVSPKVQAAIDARAKAATAPLLDELRKPHYTTTHAHTFILSPGDDANVTVNESRKTFTLGS